MDNIEKMFRDEVRDKKRVGSNIFSRVSTRKGGSNQALRTPYLYMTAKEKKRLNGEVRTFNMNDILSYSNFSEKDEKEQKDLMNHWRKIYKSVEIQKQMGISRTLFYRILKNLNIDVDTERVASAINPKNKTVLSDEDMNKYKKEFIDYSIFRDLVREQQGELINAYVEDYGTVKAVSNEWTGSEVSYLYYVRDRANREGRQKKKTEAKTKSKSIATSAKKEKSPKEQTPSEIERKALELLNSIGYFDKKKDEEQTEDTPVTTESTPTEEPVADTTEPDDHHNSNISINTDSFSFELKGRYNAQTIIKRIQLALEVLEDEKELLDLEIKISGNK